MFFIHLLVSLFELALMVIMSGLVIYTLYKVFIKANPDFDMEDEVRKGNPAVGIMVGSIMISAALLLHKGLGASVGMFSLAVSTPSEIALPLWQVLLLTLGHLILSLAIAVFTVSVTLRLFGRLVRHMNPEMRLSDHLQRGNIAVGIVLSAVVFIATYYVGDGVSAITKALVPQPKIGTIEIMK